MLKLPDECEGNVMGTTKRMKLLNFHLDFDFMGYFGLDCSLFLVGSGCVVPSVTPHFVHELI